MLPTFDEALSAQRAGDFATAERGYLALPTSRNALYNLATVYRQTGRWSEAEAAYRTVVDQYPDLAIAKRSLAMCLLALRRYAEAWPLYEARREVQGTTDPSPGYPEWRGEPLNGRRIVVVAEQGFGDQIMFGRYLGALRAMGARVIVACDRRAMGRLFELAGCEVTASGEPLPAADFWAFFCSLPLRLGLGEPGPAAYLPLSGAGGGIGVFARGNPAQQNDRNRSLSPEAAAELLTLGRDLAPEVTGAADFLDTARIIAGLDLVISVDTSVANLACSMGKPCWILLPALGRAWRYNDGQRSDWYPAARLFRQQSAGDWAGVLDRVRRELG